MEEIGSEHMHRYSLCRLRNASTSYVTSELCTCILMMTTTTLMMIVDG